jgi:hypothetical protein
VLSAYFHYCNLAEADFLSSNQSFENPDQENPLTDYQKESKVFVSSTFSATFLPGINHFEQLSRLSSSTSSLDQKSFILRC